MNTTGYSAQAPLAAMGKQNQKQRTRETETFLLQCAFSALPHEVNSMPDGKGEMFTGPSFIIRVRN